MDVALRTQHPDFLTDLRDSGAKEDVLGAVQRDHDAPVAGPLETDLPAIVRLLDRPHVERRLEPAVPEVGGIGVLRRVPRRRSERGRQNQVNGIGVVVGEREVRTVAEQAEVEPRFELLRALRFQHVRRLQAARKQPSDPVLRGRLPGALGDTAEDLREIGS